jgi:prepilin-type N-terminal cleavage/methylation domain-containing protein
MMCKPQPIFRSANARGFTLVELLVVIGIIALIAGLAIPLIMRAYGSAERTRIAGDLQAIATALQAYHDDHGDYPRPTATHPGSQILAWALVAPAPLADDGAEGPGFRVRPQGRVYGPYIAADRFGLRQENPADPTTYELMDRKGFPILYYPASPVRPNLHAARGYLGPNGLYNPQHNDQRLNPDDMISLMGAEADGSLAQGEQPAYTGPFILWTVGGDETFGTRNDVANFDLRTN